MWKMGCGLWSGYQACVGDYEYDDDEVKVENADEKKRLTMLMMMMTMMTMMMKLKMMKMVMMIKKG